MWSQALNQLHWGPGQIACPAWTPVCSSVKWEQPSLSEYNLRGLE